MSIFEVFLLALAVRHTLLAFILMVRSPTGDSGKTVRQAGGRQGQQHYPLAPLRDCLTSIGESSTLQS